MLYYYPNRPVLVPPDPKDPLDPKPDYLNSLEASGKYIAEQKWNGDNTLIFTDTMTFWNRQKEKLRYAPSVGVREELERWPKESLINAELVHNKTKTIKDLIIVHCIMVWKDELLLGKTWGDSRKILDDCVEAGLSGPHVRVSPVWGSGFWGLYREADGEIIEGIILKNPTGKIVFSTTPINDVPWMMKIRKPSKKYAF